VDAPSVVRRHASSSISEGGGNNALRADTGIRRLSSAVHIDCSAGQESHFVIEKKSRTFGSLTYLTNPRSGRGVSRLVFCFFGTKASEAESVFDLTITAPDSLR
jgi:hypothetical protein